jgi:hypothetical protein
MRRRLRERRREREALLLDLGALVYELHRQGKRSPELLQRKASQIAVVDEEVRELEARLEDDPPNPQPLGMEAELEQALPEGSEPDAAVYSEHEEGLTEEYELGDEELDEHEHDEHEHDEHDEHDEEHDEHDQDRAEHDLAEHAEREEPRA